MKKSKMPLAFMKEEAKEGEMPTKKPMARESKKSSRPKPGRSAGRGR